MRRSLLNPLAERRHALRSRGGHPAAPQPRPSAAQLANHAGAPTDQAAYACQCGYLFAAAVTTTVVCPHCGLTQAW